ncbi:MAG: Fe-S-containing hydro-lyase [Firmicutes bacterium]|jgi:fumarate hydratase subunit beta|nr:Fe-S-containing hydro-lyase [Bacillota bacterium]
MEHHITEPFTKEKFKDLKAGDAVLLTGTVYTARDAAHKRMIDMLERGESLPFDLKNAVIYYVGPTPEKPGNPIGSAGPTTSYRMDAYAPRLLDLGETGMIGKGQRSQAVKDAALRNGAVYFAAIGGAGALMAQRVESAEIIAFEDLGAEAVRRLRVRDFPVTVVLDSEGGNLYEEGRKAYLESRA